MEFLKKRKTNYILAFLLLVLGVVFFQLNNSLVTDTFLEKILTSAYGEMDEYQLGFTKKMVKVFQIIFIFIFVLRGIVIASLMKACTYLMKGFKGIKFSTLLNITFVAEFVFIISEIWGYLHLKSVGESPLEYVYYKPLSLINTFDYETIDRWLVSLYQSINLFELGYVALLIGLLVTVFKKSISKNIEFVLVSYVFPYVSFISLMLFISYGN